MAEENTGQEEGIRRCDYCRLPIPRDPETTERDGVEYAFCSTACRDAQEGSDRVFTQYHGFRRFRPRVSALDAGLPQGIPRNSFVLLTDLAGTRSEALMAELVWRALQRGEPVVYVSFLEPPVSVVQKFADLEWNVLPYLESGQLRILDCFTYRLDDRERMADQLNEWNRHLASVVGDATATVRDPSDMSRLHNQLDDMLSDGGMNDAGIVVVDSLTELGTLVQPVQAYDFLKDVRAEICKGRFVPVFAGATITGDERGFPHDLGYMVDGIVELRLNEEIVDDALIKQIRVRKMNGVLTYPQWSSYEYTSGRGIVEFDPLEEIKRSEEEGPDPDGDGDPADSDVADAESVPASERDGGATGPAVDEAGPAAGAEDDGPDAG